MPRDTVFQFRLTVWNHVPNMNNNNNNNNQSPLMQMRDRLFHMMFVRMAIAYGKLLPPPARSAIEKSVLCFALLCLFILSYIHVTFIHTPMNCLDSIQKEWPKEGILRIEILPNYIKNRYSLQDSYDREARIRQFQMYNKPFYDSSDVPETAKSTFEKDSKTDKKDEASSTPPVLKTDGGIIDETQDLELFEENASLLSKERNVSFEVDSSSTRTISGNASENFEEHGLLESWLLSPKELPRVNFRAILPEDYYIVEYSLEYGYLKMSAEARKHLKIPIKLITLDPANDACFGNFFTRTLLDNFLGYDDVLLASISKLASKEQTKGFIRNVVTEHYFRFVNVMDRTSYAFAAMIMLVFTFSISTLLRYSHHQIFLFIVHLLHVFEFRSVSNIPTAPLLTVILALVGMEAIMSEFFTDPTTSFYVILVVWIADQYDAICCRTAVSKRHWLRFFYLYHFAFYAYEYRFSGQYSDLALFTTCCFIFHSMVYFFHHFELVDILRRHDHLHHQDQPASPQGPVSPSSDNSPDTSPTEEETETLVAEQDRETHSAQPNGESARDETAQEDLQRNSEHVESQRQSHVDRIYRELSLDIAEIFERQKSEVFQRKENPDKTSYQPPYFRKLRLPLNKPPVYLQRNSPSESGNLYSILCHYKEALNQPKMKSTYRKSPCAPPLTGNSLVEMYNRCNLGFLSKSLELAYKRSELSQCARSCCKTVNSCSMEECYQSCEIPLLRNSNISLILPLNSNVYPSVCRRTLMRQ